MQEEQRQPLRRQDQVISLKPGLNTVSSVLQQAPMQAALARQLAQARKSRSMLYPFIGRSKQFQCWQHYPNGDALDQTGGWQFYYHAHDATREGGARHPHEHGHIHLFRRSLTGQLSHLTGLSLDARGTPLTWFTTNQWVTGERWKQASGLQKSVHALRLQVNGPLAGVARWLADLVQAYAQPLCDMLQARDEALASHCLQSGVSVQQALNDRRISVWSSFPIDWPCDAIALRGTVLKYCN